MQMCHCGMTGVFSLRADKAASLANRWTSGLAWTCIVEGCKTLAWRREARRPCQNTCCLLPSLPQRSHQSSPISTVALAAPTTKETWEKRSAWRKVCTLACIASIKVCQSMYCLFVCLFFFQRNCSNSSLESFCVGTLPPPSLFLLLLCSPSPLSPSIAPSIKLQTSPPSVVVFVSFFV